MFGHPDARLVLSKGGLVSHRSIANTLVMMIDPYVHDWHAFFYFNLTYSTCKHCRGEAVARGTTSDTPSVERAFCLRRELRILRGPSAVCKSPVGYNPRKDLSKWIAAGAFPFQVPRTRSPLAVMGESDEGSPSSGDPTRRDQSPRNAQPRINRVRHAFLFTILLAFLSESRAQDVKHDIPYASPAHERQVLDVYSPRGAKKLPVVFWIHGGGWQAGDKTSIQLKPQAFMDKGFVFVSTNYRLLPVVDMETIVSDIAKSIRWVHEHIAEFGGDPDRLLVMGHSAGAQLAALICADDRYLKTEGLPLSIIKGCVPVDGDTFDVPAIIETAETRRRVHGQPQAKFGHREKFGNDPAKHRDLSVVTHVAKGKAIPPFLILHVADHPDTTAQAQRLASALKDAGIPVKVHGGQETTHNKINADLGLPDDPGTKAVFEFVDEVLKK